MGTGMQTTSKGENPSMSGKQRMRLAMGGGRPDRVPLMCQLSLGHIYRNAGIDPISYWYTSRGAAEGFITMAERYHFDGILVNFYGRDPAILSRIVRVEPYHAGHRVLWQNGDETYLAPNDDPLPLRRGDVEELKRGIAGIEPETVPIYASEADIPGYCMDILDIVLQARGSELSIHGEIGTAFERLLVLCGSYGDGLIALLDDPQKCKRVLDRINQSCISDARIQCRRGIDAMKLSSPFAGGGFISRQMYREFVLPYERQVISIVNSEFGIPCYIHTCGAIGDRLDLIADTGAQGIECLDPFPLGNVDLAGAVDQVGNRVFIKGNLDSVNELMFTTPGEVTDIARKRIEIGMTNPKGFILSTACSVAPGVPQENILALHGAVEQFGRY